MIFAWTATVWSACTSLWQHPCEDGILISPQDIFICWQQARSDAVICAAGMAHAIIGTTAHTSRTTKAPSCRRAFTLLYGIRAPSQRCVLYARVALWYFLIVCGRYYRKGDKQKIAEAFHAPSSTTELRRHRGTTTSPPPPSNRSSATTATRANARSCRCAGA